MGKAKYLSVMLVMLLIGVCISSCNKDDNDEPKSSIQDYFVEVDVTGGGLDAAELNGLKVGVNENLAEYELEGYDRDEAIYTFDRLLKEFKKEFSEGMSGVNGTLKMIFYLKTSKGDTVKKGTLSITKDGCTLN